jgi:2-phospho-L-lactate guanylyltransferase
VRTAAILPVKRFSQAKQRLGTSVADQLRLALAAAMVGDVMDALGHTPAITLTVVVTSEERVARAARALGALVLADEQERGQSAAASLGIERALAEGAERVLCVPGDCPALAPADLQRLLTEDEQHALGRARVAIVPDRHGTGTNGLLIAPPGVLSPSFGPGSCERHRELARAAGAQCRIARVPSLLLDIDTGADLEVLRERLERSPARAARTRAVLGAHATPAPSVLSTGA